MLLLLLGHVHCQPSTRWALRVWPCWLHWPDHVVPVRTLEDRQHREHRAHGLGQPGHVPHLLLELAHPRPELLEAREHEPQHRGLVRARLVDRALDRELQRHLLWGLDPRRWGHGSVHV